MKFPWRVATDTPSGKWWIGDTYNPDKKYDFRVESGTLVADLPNTPWPARSTFHFETNASSPILKCEGIKTCGSEHHADVDYVRLPNL